ncbi:hypothetical protein CL614_03745 [archaeon]|nr:hypothetical protein [archaeon]
MNNPYDLEQLGKEAALSYISDNVTLNDSILKTAQNHNLNRQQVNRVVESANVDAYLHLIKKAEDNYVDFPLADSATIYSNLSYQESLPKSSNDYEAPPTKTATFNLFNIEDAEFEKTASAKIRYGQLRKEASEVEGKCNYIYDQAELTRGEFIENYNNLWNFTKQAVLQEENLNNVFSIIKEAAPSYSQYIKDDFSDYMKETMRHIDITKEAAYTGIINPKSNIYNTAKELEYLGDRYVKIASAFKHYIDQYNVLRKEAGALGGLKKLIVGAGQTITGTTTAILKGMAKNKGLVLAGIGGAAAYQVGKSKGRRSQGEILQAKMLPAKYRNIQY